MKHATPDRFLNNVVVIIDVPSPLPFAYCVLRTMSPFRRNSGQELDREKPHDMVDALEDVLNVNADDDYLHRILPVR